MDSFRPSLLHIISVAVLLCQLFKTVTVKCVYEEPATIEKAVHDSLMMLQVGRYKGKMDWIHGKVGKSSEVSIYDALHVDKDSNYSVRYDMSRKCKEEGQCSLFIKELVFEDAGYFYCSEKSHNIDIKHGNFNLIVFEPSDKFCEKKIESSYTELWCQLRSNGQLEHHLEWLDNSGTVMNSSNTKTRDGLSTSILRLPPNQGKRSYVCRVRYDQDKTMISKYNCTISVEQESILTSPFTDLTQSPVSDNQRGVRDSSTTTIAAVAAIAVVGAVIALLLLVIWFQRRRRHPTETTQS